VNKFYSARVSIHFTASSFARLLICLVLVIVPSLALAQAGSLDPTFANNGIFSSTFNQLIAFATSVALQSDGKILVGGEIGNLGAVVRFNTNGTPDTTFGSAGVVTIRFRDVDNFTVGLGIQSSGKIVVAGTGLPGGGQIVRLNPNGSIDTTFGNNGSVTLSVTPSVMLLQPDDRILLGGAASGSAERDLQRFTVDGQLDSGFGTGGSAPLFGLGGIALQSDGKILVTTGSGGFGAAGTLARYNSDGNLDTFFAISGQLAALASPAIAVQPNGHIITGGSVTSSLSLAGNATGFGLNRFFPSGTIEFLFGTHGGVVSQFPNAQSASISSLAVQPNSAIVAAGSAGTSSQAFALARYITTGQLDPGFGNGGLVTTSFGSGANASISALALQSDGKIVVAGSVNQTSFVVARYRGQ
jgi:uncharacterized delta-60 repeat protein